MKLTRATKEIVSSASIGFMELAGAKYLRHTALTVFAYLFEIFGVDVGIDMREALHVADNRNKDTSEGFTNSFHKACSVPVLYYRHLNIGFGYVVPTSSEENNR